MFHMRIHAFGTTSVNGQWHRLWKWKKSAFNVYSWTRDSKPTWCAVHHRHTSGVPAILGRWRFVQRYVRRVGMHCNYWGSNPGLCLGQRRCHKTWSTKQSHRFCQRTRWAFTWRGSVTRWSVDATSHSFDKHVREPNHRNRFRVPRGDDRDTNFTNTKCARFIPTKSSIVSTPRRNLAV